MTSSSPPEFLLAAACAMWPPSDRRTEAIRGVATEPLDWARFVRVARRHRVLGLVHDGLKRADVEMPQDIAREIAAGATALLRENLTMAGEALRLQRLFDDAGLPILFFKGSSLAMLAYGNLALRHSKDIDLLVSPDTMEPATALLDRAGYRRFDPPPETSSAQLRVLIPRRKDFGFVHEATGLEIELHWRLFLNPHAMDEASVMADSRIVRINDTAGLRTLGPDDLFTYLCVHGSLHLWNRLKWLADIGALLGAEPDGGRERLVKAAEARGAGSAAIEAILLCGRLLAIRPPPAVIARGKSLKARLLERTALRAMSRGEQEWIEAPFATSLGSLSALCLGESWRYRLAELRNLMSKDTDVLSVRLPERLRFLYPILRVPLWVWRRANRRKARRSEPNARNPAW